MMSQIVTEIHLKFVSKDGYITKFPRTNQFSLIQIQVKSIKVTVAQLIRC